MEVIVVLGFILGVVSPVSTFDLPGGVVSDIPQFAPTPGAIELPALPPANPCARLGSGSLVRSGIIRDGDICEGLDQEEETDPTQSIF